MHRKGVTSKGPASHFRDDRGAVLVIVAVFMVAAMILMAFVLDRGRAYIAQTQLQNAVDAAALAGIQEFCGGTQNPRTVAETYGTANGVTVDAAAPVVIGYDRYMNVRANQEVSQVFGGFAGVSSVTVAAQATAMRSCRFDYQFVADENIEFTGTDNDLRGTGIFAGQCFSSTANSGNQFGVITVTTAGPGPATVCGGKDAIDIKSNTYESKIYGAPQVTVVQAATQKVLKTGTETAIQAYNRVKAQTPVNCGSLTPPSASDLHCLGDFKSFGPGFTGIIVAQGDIDLDNNATYSNALIASENGTITFNNGTTLAAGTIIFAPDIDGYVKETGKANVENGAYIFATNMKFSGGGVNPPDGITAYGPGPFSLVQ